jgi:hypothetical protein
MSQTTEAVEGILESTNKRIALLIAVLALLLAATEMLGQNAKQEAQASNIEASNLWAFFQAKTIRRQQVQVAATDNELRLLTITDEATRTAVQAQIQRWRQDAARLDSEPETNEGRRELMVRAQAKERGRDLAQARDGWLDFASASLQVGIVIASAAIITGITLFVWGAFGLGILGLSLAAIGLFAPTIMG